MPTDSAFAMGSFVGVCIGSADTGAIVRPQKRTNRTGAACIVDGCFIVSIPLCLGSTEARLSHGLPISCHINTGPTSLGNLNCFGCPERGTWQRNTQTLKLFRCGVRNQVFPGTISSGLPNMKCDLVVSCCLEANGHRKPSSTRRCEVGSSMHSINPIRQQRSCGNCSNIFSLFKRFFRSRINAFDRPVLPKHFLRVLFGDVT